MYQGCKKYIPFTPVSLPDRTWPNNRIEKAPTWCSVDLRDGNQALVTPMNLQEKLDFFKLLVDIGFKEIEVGFPSASETEYEILRALIDGHYIPDDVTIQVLVQAREHLIRKTFEAVRGAKNVIIHFYNSTSTLQRKVVFKKDMQRIIDIAVAGAKLVRELTEADQSGTNEPPPQGHHLDIPGGAAVQSAGGTVGRSADADRLSVLLCRPQRRFDRHLYAAVLVRGDQHFAGSVQPDSRAAAGRLQGADDAATVPPVRVA